MITIPQLLLQNSPFGNLWGSFNGMSLTPGTGSSAGERSAIDYIMLALGAVILIVGIIFLALSSRTVGAAIESAKATGKTAAALAA